MTAEKYFEKGNTFYYKGDFNSAIKNYSKAIEINPNYADAYNNRGYAKYKLGKYNDALADCNKALAINPNYTDAYLSRAECNVVNLRILQQMYRQKTSVYQVVKQSVSIIISKGIFLKLTTLGRVLL